MRFTKLVPTDFEVTTLMCAMGVRYWEDATVNGQDEDDDAPKIPLKFGDRWLLEIDLATGRIKDWPEGTTAQTHYKVCDDGVYKLFTANGEIVAHIDGYVPSMLAPKGNGFGDYVILDIGPDGIIKGWNPDLSYFAAAP